MYHLKVALLLYWFWLGCTAADGGVLSKLRNRLFGKQDNSGESASSPSERPLHAKPPFELRPPIQIAGSDEASEPIGEVAESIVARVNNDVILAEEIFNPVRGMLAKAQQEMPPAQFTQYRSMLIQKQLRDLIERQLLIQEAKRTLPEPLIKRLEVIADKEFGKRIESEMKRMEVNTESELRRKMQERGESLDQIREFQRGTFVAQQYLQMQLQPRLDVSRDEMVDYYNEHRDQFKKEGGVVWSEIFISTEKCGSSESALQKANEIVKRIRAGADFGELAKAASEGATAPTGGHWDLTTKGSYIVTAVDEAIFSLPVGKVSDPIEGPKGWHIVRVEDAQRDNATSFVDAHEEIRKTIREQKIAKESQHYVQDLARKAHITTIFDRPTQKAN